MIKIAIIIGKDGLFRSCKAEGHALMAKKGQDIVCAAVSVLMRSCLMALDKEPGIQAEHYITDGELWLDISAVKDGAKEFLRGVGSMLIDGLQSVSQEYPDNCSLEIFEEN
ncbi:MAG: ribosomal-processing cysteine protease Prp [Spirochaetaceae bacterium]|jgi:uncharacterized protein YsxB (DUF464 family)|nr:ribosomal-processing cysteine protease Prp [Spirochaetaceae bacterium]